MEWNLDPIALSFGQAKITYYGIFFSLALICNYLSLDKLQHRYWKQTIDIYYFYMGAFFMALSGGRLVHLAFYEWPRFSSNPLVFFDFFSGGQASHGVFFGLILWIIIYCRLTKKSMLLLLDTIAPMGAIGASFIRLGNFCNSEIVGKVTNIPWAVKFLRYDQELRHPVQLYEFSVLFILGLVLFYGVIKRDWLKTTGLCTSLWLVVYMGGRNFLEFFKARLVFSEIESGVSMGQILSFFPAFIGFILLLKILKGPNNPSRYIK